MITAILKINSDLERISDHAVNIAESVKIISNKPQVKPLISIPMMAKIAQEMLNTALDAFVQEKPDDPPPLVPLEGAAPVKRGGQGRHRPLQLLAR